MSKIRRFEEAEEKLQEMGIDIYEFFSCICEDMLRETSYDHESDLIDRYIEQRFDLC